MLEVKTTPDGRVLARRMDGRPLTPEDREEAKRMALASYPPASFQQPHEGKEYLALEEVSRLLRETFGSIDKIYPSGTIAWLKAERPELFEETLSLERVLSQEGKALAKGQGNRAAFDRALNRYKQVWQEAIGLRRAHGNHKRL